jgi:hypothetical protein
VKETLEKTTLAPCLSDEEGGEEVTREDGPKVGREGEGERGLTLMAGVRSRRAKT